MRLINADKLRHELIMGHDLIGAKYTDMADTVEAIPIDWIKSWADERCCGDLTIYGELFYDMIEDWEEGIEI